MSDHVTDPFYAPPDVKLPTISYVIATFNNSKTLRDCLVSITNQDYPRELVEIVAADGGSNDGTIEILKEFGVRIVHNPSVTEKGVNGGKNRAIHTAVSDVVLVVDADNILSTRTYTRELVRPFLAYRGVVAVSPVITASTSWPSFERYAGYVYDPFDHRFVLSCEERTLLETSDPPPDYVCLLRRSGEKIYIGNGTAVLREAIIRVGGYDFDLETGIRLSQAGPMYLSTRSRLFHHNATSIRQYIRKRVRGVDELVRFSSSRTGPSGFGQVVLLRGHATALRVASQVVVNLTVLYPLTVAVSESVRRRDSAFLWHALLAPLATLAYISALLRNRSGRHFLLGIVWSHSSLQGKSPDSH